MAKIKVLKDEQLKGGIDNTDVYPVSSTQALYSHYLDNGEMKVRQREYTPGVPEPEKLEDRLKDHEDDTKELHRKAEKLEVGLINDKENVDIEFTGDTQTMHLTGTAGLSTYGDEPEEPLSPDSGINPHMATYSMTVTDSEGSVFTPETSISGNAVIADFNPTAPSTYKVRFSVTNYDGERSTTKYVDSYTYLVLRKYFGFYSETPQDVTVLNGSDKNHAVAETITVNPNSAGGQFKHIYIAIPKYLIGNRTIYARQPDALNAPFPLRKIQEVQRTIGGVSYTYCLFESGTTSSSDDGYVDSTVSKRLTLSIV